MNQHEIAANQLDLGLLTKSGLLAKYMKHACAINKIDPPSSAAFKTMIHAAVKRIYPKLDIAEIKDICAAEVTCTE